MILTTTATIVGYRLVETKGMVRGSTLRAKHIGKDIIAGLRTLVGGEIKEYTKMMAESREEATQRMVSAAEELGANAVIEIRFSTAMIMSNSSEILAYGTAVVIEKE